MYRRRRQIGFFGGSVAPFVPTDIAGLQAWYDPSDAASLTVSLGLVSQMNDKSGNNRHMVQATGAKQPLTGTASTQGKNMLLYTSAGGSYLDTTGSTFSVNQPNTVFVVAKANTTADTAAIFGSRANPQEEMVWITSGTKWTIYGGAVTPSAVSADTVQHIHSVKFNGATSDYYIDGVAVLTNAAGSVFGLTNGITIGGRFGIPLTWDGPIGEFIVYNAALTAPQIAQVNTYLAAKW